jgi:xanthine dehydrogenase accessory factor
VHSPAGAWIGARTAPEIALSIMSDVVRAIRIDGLAPPPAPAAGEQQTAIGPRTATDPICGMTVLVGPEAIQAGDDYFCGTGCRDAFLARA